MSRIQKHISTLSDSNNFMLEWQNQILGITWADLKSQITATLFTGDTITVADLVSTDTTDSSSSTTGAIKTAGGLGVAKAANIGTSIGVGTVLTVGSTNTASGTINSLGTLSGLTIFNRAAAVLDALNYSVFTTGNVFYINSASTTNNVLSVDSSGTVTALGTTDSSTPATGALLSSGGLGVAKKLFVGTDVNLATVSGVTTIGSTTPTTVSAAGLTTVANATDATASNATASIQTSGGLAVAKKAYIGTQLNTQSVVKRPITTTTVAAGSLITGDMLVTGYIEVTGTTNSSAFDSAANITTALGTSPIGTTFDCYINTMGATPMTATNVLTVTAGAGMQFMKQISAGDSASAFLATVTATAGVHSGIFRFTFDTATTCSVQRIG